MYTIDFNKNIILIIITLIIDIVFISILKFSFSSLTNVDKYFIYAMLISHIFFIIYVIKRYIFGLEILHYMVFFSISFGLFISNKYILMTILFLIVTIQFLWIALDKCILNDIIEQETCKKKEFGFSKLLNCYIILLTIIISIKIGIRLY